MSALACWLCIAGGLVLLFLSDGYGSDALAALGFVLVMLGFWPLVLS